MPRFIIEPKLRPVPPVPARLQIEAYKMLIDASRKQRQAPDFLDGQPVEFQWPPRPRERHIFDWRFHG